MTLDPRLCARSSPRPARELGFYAGLALVLVAASGCAEPPSGARPPELGPPRKEAAQHQIFSPKVEGSVRELAERGERALLAQRWREAADAYEALVGAEPTAKDAPAWMASLGAAYEGLGELERARATYRRLVAAFPADTHVRGARMREVSLDAYLDDWKALGELGDTILASARPGEHDVDRMLGLGARALRKVQTGDDVAALRDVNEGLELMESLHYGASGRLPVPAAQLRFALAEVRRVRSEKIALQPVTDDFLVKMEMRCQGLLDAQSAYADAIRSVDPTWAKMSGVRVGEMYRTLHRELMAVPPDRAKSESDRDLFYAIMHVRYRALVEKGMEMMTRTIDFAKKSDDESVWVTRAREAKEQMQRSLDEEKAQFAKLPYTEAEVERTLEMMRERALARAQGKPVPPLKLPKGK
ncbi:MAG: hypothetical protein IPF92_29025 [Myxococcales bacterium]|nr:hypothetical protein [Myxococcales bacterium]